MKNKRVFVSGGAGVIGTALVEKLIENGAEVFVGDLKPCPTQWINKIRYRVGDLNTITLAELQSFDPQIFFHLAASFERSEESYPFLEENFQNNIQLSHWLLYLSKQLTSLKKFVFASSYLIYDSSLYTFEKVQESATVLKESSSVSPRNLCGMAKLLCEQELQFIQNFQKNFSFISARIFRVYGKQSRDIISRWIRQACREEELFVYHLEGKFDYIFAEDVAEGLLRLSQTDQQGIVNLCKGEARTVQDILTILKKYFPNLQTSFVPVSAKIEQSKGNIERLKEWIDWQPAFSLENAIPLLITYEKEQMQKIEEKKYPAVLITSISNKVPLLHAVRQAADKLGKFQIIHGCDSALNGVGQYEVDYFWHCPILENLTIQDVINYCKTHAISAIIPTRDADCLFFAKHKDILKEHDVSVLVSSLATVALCVDKWQFAKTLQEKHLPAIPTFLYLKTNAFSHFVVKEREGSGSKQVGLRLSLEQAITYGRQLQSPIFQPFIEGKEWSVDLYRTCAKQIKGCVARQRNIVQEGESRVTTTQRYPELEKLCTEIADVLDIYGHVVFQVIEEEQKKFHVIECNPRFGGASTASIAVGLDSFVWFFQEVMKIHLQNYPFLRQKEIRQIRYLTDRVQVW